MDNTQFSEMMKFMREDAQRREEAHTKQIEQLRNNGNEAIAQSVTIQPPEEYIERKITAFTYDPVVGLTFDKWYERTATVFASDRGKQVPESEKCAIIRSKLTSSDYQTFAGNILPKKPEELTLIDTVKHLKQLFGRRETIFARRFKVLQIQKKSDESFATYTARVNQAAEEFELSSFDSDDLKVQLFTQGLTAPTDSRIRKKLMESVDDRLTKRTEEGDAPTTNKLKINDMLAIARRMMVRDEESKVIENQPSTTVASKPRGSIPKCRMCGDTHWHRDCPFTSKTCGSCSATGHKTGFCKSARDFNERNKKRGKEPSTVVHSTSVQHKPSRKTLKPKINGIGVVLKHDMGSDWTIITEKDWKRCGSPKLLPSKETATSASGGAIESLGSFSAVIELKGRIGIVPVHVTKRNLSLFGNNALEALELWDQPITTYCDSIETNPLAEEVRNKFPKLFSSSLGRCTLQKASLKLKEGARVPFCRARPVAFGVRSTLDEAYDKLVDKGVFTPINYAHTAAPVVVVKKKDGSIRVTADYSTGLNRALESFNYPLPTPESIFATLSGNDTFSTLDLTEAFLQIEFDDEAKDLMAVNTHRGLYRVNRLQFGVKTAPGQFQQLMDSILAGSGASPYLDDIIVPGKGETDHKKRLFDILKRLEDAGLRLKLGKCKFGQPSIKFLGKIIDAEGQRPDPEKLQIIRDLPQPADISQLRAFLGAINWYGSFIPNLKDLRGPLDELLRKDEKFEWTERRSRAFTQLKQALHSDLALSHYDPGKPLVVAADASSYGVGAALLQRLEDSTLRPIQYAAISFNNAERNYAQVEREALALVYAVKKFHRYIYGRHFELQTDHKPLLKIFGDKNGIPVHTANRLRRYANTLLGYDFTIRYIDNASFAYADFVPRLISTHAKPGAEDIVIAEIRQSDYEEEETEFMVDAVNSLPVKLEDLQRATSDCSHLQLVMSYVRAHWPTQRRQIPDSEAAEYFIHRQDLRIIQDCLFSGDRPIIPPILRTKVLGELHTGHPGSSRMQGLANEKCFWPNMSRHISSFVQRCSKCATNAKSPVKEILHPWPVPNKPWKRIHIDFAGPIDHDSFLVVVDAHSNWPEVARMRSTTAEKTTEALSEIFARWGTPETIVSDNGPQFISSTFKDFCANNGIKHVTSAPYHPQSNGRAEKFVDTLKRGLLKLEGEGSIDEKLRILLSSYRQTPCAARGGSSPFELMTGRKMPSRLDLLQPAQRSTVSLPHSMSKQFNQHHGARLHTYRAGDPIFYQMHSGNGWTWQTGSIVKQLGRTNYLITVDNRILKAHTNQLKRRYPTEEEHEDDTYEPSGSPQSTQTIPHTRATEPDEAGDSDNANLESDSEEFESALEESTDVDLEDEAPEPVRTRAQRSTAGRLPERYRDFVIDLIMALTSRRL
ncbi:PREDICTED: uncharacterized protein K02A2.6-like [Vollenhovia emeryi]|uniref:uncharacterized protein K02A2.6-like n=1 Tax=Vollenhovia emeryi TaxID=411798 RepID=UPI0005F40B54|nr:PREDICTED: uncharacterized protein K02A2.6-like [Vollenhovia emeryi]